MVDVFVLFFSLWAFWEGNGMTYGCDGCDSVRCDLSKLIKRDGIMDVCMVSVAR